MNSEYPRNLIRLNETCKQEGTVRISKHLSIAAAVHKGHALCHLHFNFAPECAIRRVKEIREGLKLNDLYKVPVHSDD
jgi:hypothetical protein